MSYVGVLVVEGGERWAIKFRLVLVRSSHLENEHEGMSARVRERVFVPVRSST